MTFADVSAMNPDNVATLIVNRLLQRNRHFGLDGFEHLQLPDLILGKFPYVSFLVGSVLRKPPPPNRVGPLHRIVIGENWIHDRRTEF